MASDHETTTSHLSKLNAKSPLLKLPPELRTAIFEFALPRGSQYNVSFSATGSGKPALLQVSRQIREETTPLFYRSNGFHVIITIDNIQAVKTWALSVSIGYILRIGCIMVDFELSASQHARGIDDRYVNLRP